MVHGPVSHAWGSQARRRRGGLATSCRTRALSAPVLVALRGRPVEDAEGCCAGVLSFCLICSTRASSWGPLNRHAPAANPAEIRPVRACSRSQYLETPTASATSATVKNRRGRVMPHPLRWWRPAGRGMPRCRRHSTRLGRSDATYAGLAPGSARCESCRGGRRAGWRCQVRTLCQRYR